MLINANFPRIVTVFGEMQVASSILFSTSIRNVLKRILPNEFILRDFTEEEAKYELYSLLRKETPFISASEWGNGPFHFSLLLLCVYQSNTSKFFYEMISRWLLPGKRLDVENFLATSFVLPELSDTQYLLTEAVVTVDTEQELDRVRKNLSILESEIRLGAVSFYQANRILEIKGVSSNEKTALIQETISSLLRKRQRDFDYDIFSQMQHFLVMCREEFKETRECQHMTRMIYVFYLFRKNLKSLIESLPDRRHISFKINQVRLHLPFGVKKVLGVFVGINFLKEYEIFEERHLIKSIKGYFPQVKMVEDSLFVITNKEDKTHIIYLEVEKGDESCFSTEELKLLRQRLPEDIKSHIEKLMPSIFMPRNEEEVMKNIVMLSHELKYLKDVPQLIISFEEQTDSELTFTVILLRVLVGGQEASIQELYRQSSGAFTFIEDRVKKVGLLRNKYPKEATVFRLKLPKSPFMREDNSVDLLKARQEISSELYNIVGEFRDYNGGMIAKQNEVLCSLKKQVGELSRKDERLLEEFFHSLYPVESRSLVSPVSLKILFTMFLELSHLSEFSGFDFYTKEDEEAFYLMLASREKQSKEKMEELMKQLSLPSSQFVSVSLLSGDVHYLGCLILSSDLERRHFLIQGIEGLQEELKAFTS